MYVKLLQLSHDGLRTKANATNLERMTGLNAYGLNTNAPNAWGDKMVGDRTNGLNTLGLPTP